MNKLRDHHVRHKSREDIAQIAMAWWKLASRTSQTFNICNFVQDVLAKKITTKGILRTQFYESTDELVEQACVTYAPLTLHVLRKVWDDAFVGMDYARFILAHEVGHIILHDHKAIAFSDDEAAQLKFVQNEESAEWQANMFADLFLVPDHIAARLANADVISGLCGVSEKVATRRLAELARVKSLLQPKYEGEICCVCGNFTLVRNGICMKCDTCGSTTECS